MRNQQAAIGNGTLSDWLQLLRLPNLWTVPGDPVAGFMLAGGAADGNVWAIACASILLYAAGLLLNDWADAEEDRRERPERPLPSGRIPRHHALIAASAAALAGVLTAFAAGLLCGIVAQLLLLAVVVYNLWAKQHAIAGWIVMGLCRALSVLLGVAAATNWTVVALVAATGIGIYIVALTALADTETRAAGAPADRRWAPALVVAGLALVTMGLTRHQPQPLLMPFAALPLFVAARTAMRLHTKPGPATTQRAVGALIRNLLLIQAMVAVAAPDGIPAAAILLALWPIATLCSRKYASS